ncbi:MAG: cation transporter [Clostridia bacterium]|nr:cation transporter [Clostridia bacterium]
MKKDLAMHISFVTIIINIILSLFKFIAGFVSNSSAMISDAVHSASDVLSTIIVMIGIKASQKTSDKEHPYGHERIECVASFLLSVALFITGLSIGVDAAKTIVLKTYENKESIGFIALIAAVLSIVTKEWMFWYTRSGAKKLSSTALMADAWHHRSDALSSVGALIGIGLSMAGFPIFDPIASIIICVLILKVAIDIFMEACNRMIDTAADEQTEKKLIETIKSVDGVIEVNKLKTRLFASKMYVDVEFSADGDLSLTDAHEIAHRVHDLLEESFPEIKHCMVHVNPYGKM